MKKRSKLMGRLLCLALCLCMVLVIPLVTKAETCEHLDTDKKDGRCDVCGCLMQDVYLSSISASLEGNIAVNYFMLLSDEVVADENAYMQFTMADGEIIKVPVSQSKLIDGYDVFTCEVAAKEMTDVITSQFYYGGKAAFAKDHVYSVKTYAEHIIQQNSNDPNTKALMEAMVNYGAASQLHFGYNTDNLANTGVTTAPDYSAINITEYPFTSGQGTAKVKLYSASLILNSETTLRLFFNGSITATHEGKDMKVRQRGGLYYVDIVNIAAKDLDDDVTITINDGTNSENITFNPLSYCQIVAKDTTGSYTTQMRDLAIALYLYNKAAGTYFADNGPEGATLKDALHYLSADTNTAAITTKVTSVTFGRSNQYRDIVNGSAPSVLVTDQQDTPATAYYVDNASGYDVYVLSNDVIYTPVDSTKLFQGMKAATSIDTTNLNTSRTEIFSSFMKDCNALTEVIGVKNWDTTKATMMDEVFNNCWVLDNLDLRNWEMTNVTNMKNMFRYCHALKNFDASTWYLPNVGDMAQVFLHCYSLEELNINNWGLGSAWRLYSTFGNCTSLKSVDVADWDISTVTDLTGTFMHCYALVDVDVSKWDTSNVTVMRATFNAAINLEELDISEWDVRKVTNFTQMFQGLNDNGADMKIKALDISKWEPNSAVTMNHMFYGCAQLTELDLSDWDMPNLSTTSHMFADCHKLVDLDVSGWNTPALTSMDGMFNDCRAIKVIDVSDFDTENCVEFSQIFESCGALEEIIGLNQWNTAKGNVYDEMFNQARSLKKLDLSSFDTSGAKYSNVLQNGEKNYHGYGNMFEGMSSLQELKLGEKFVFAGDGSIPASNYPKFPNPAPIDGNETKWYNAANDTYYTASGIPEKTAATYVAAGATMKDALHYLNGDRNGTKITNKVTSVTYGLTADYMDVANNNTGVLMSVEQDAPVYAYYVPNGDNYDVYLLSNDDIYLPVDCTAMFSKMGELVSVNTGNLNTSHASNMTDFFYNCPKLASIDPSNWDTRNFTNLYGIFGKCPSLTYLDVSGWNTSNLVSMHDAFVNSTGLVTIKGLENWDTSNVTNMISVFNGCTSLVNVGDIGKWDTSKVTSIRYMFYNCASLAELDINQWNTSSVTEMNFTFKGCKELVDLDLSNWDTGKVTTFSSMFSSLNSHNPDMKLKNVHFENWDTSSCTAFSYMFYGCGQLEELDLSKWDASSVTTTYHMFADCNSLRSVKFGDWDTSKLTDMNGMFNDCHSLTSLDLSGFDTQNVTNMGQLFEGCKSLTEIIGLSQWDTSNLQHMAQMFNANGTVMEIRDVDLSGWDTSGVKSTNSMFNGCSYLTTVFVGDGWDMSNVTDSGSMFNGCTSLVGGNGSTVAQLSTVDKTYACVDTVETPGYLTYKAAENNTNP